MILNNYYKWRAAMEIINFASTGSSTSYDATYTTDVVGVDGEYCPVRIKTREGQSDTFARMVNPIRNMVLSKQFSLQYSSYDGVIDNDAYTLPNLMSVSGHSISANVGVEDQAVKIIITASGNNNSDSEFIIRRIGYIKALEYRVNGDSGSWDDATKYALLMVADLDDPITVPPMGRFVVNFEYKLV